MKYLSTILVAFSIILCGCEKLIPDLPRNNPLDGKNDTAMVAGVSLKYSSYNVVGDNNNDGVINKGETVYLKVYLANNGSSAANSVKATFSTSNSYVSLFAPTTQVNYSNIAAGSTQYGSTGYATNGYYTIKFTISNSAPNNTQIPININITDEGGNTWTSSFSVTVQGTGAQISYSSYSVVGDNNNDGVINKGETVYLKVYLANNGSSAANSVKATFSTSNSYVSLFAPTTQVNFSNIAAGNTQYGSTGYATNGYYTIKFTISSSAPTNTQIPINISITDESMNNWNDSFSTTVY